MTDSFIPMYDLESLNDQQRQDYIRNVCRHMGVPDNLNLVALTYVDDGEGPSRLVSYAKRGATENVRNTLDIKITSLTNQMIGGSIVFTATAVSGKGRQEISTGSKFIDGLTGTALDDAIMTAQTRALRRVTLQFIGAGVLDESEVNQRKLVHTVSSPVAVTPQPTVQPASAPGKDVTPEPEEAPSVILPTGMTLMQPVTGLLEEAKRSEVIAQLNAQVDEPKVKKTRKRRTVNLGPTEAAVITLPGPELIKELKASEPLAVPVEQAVPAPTTTVVAAPITEPPATKKPKITPDEVKPYRARLFRLRNDHLESAGLAPKENMGIAAQMRGLAQVMFSDIDDMNDLNKEQWEKYLSTLENKVASEGAAATVKFIEETIGL